VPPSSRGNPASRTASTGNCGEGCGSGRFEVPDQGLLMAGNSPSAREPRSPLSLGHHEASGPAFGARGLHAASAKNAPESEFLLISVALGVSFRFNCLHTNGDLPLPAPATPPTRADRWRGARGAEKRFPAVTRLPPPAPFALPSPPNPLSRTSSFRPAAGWSAVDHSRGSRRNIAFRFQGR
jgi:hypothetical protein